MKASGARKALEETREKIRKLIYAGDDVVAVGDKKVKRRRHVRRWFDVFHSFYSSDGFFVVGGRDASTNELLIKKHTEKDDLVFHADIHGAPFFVVKNPERKEIPENTLKEAAEAAAAYSKAWRLGLGCCDVYYVRPEQVSKTAPSGEYLPKGGFMVYGRKEWFRGVCLQVAVGFVFEGDDVSVVGGPVSAVQSKTNFFVRIVPGDLKSGKLVEEVKKVVAATVGRDYSQRIMRLGVEDIQRLIPGGRGRVVK